jgi:hypothetical protein
MINLIFKEGNRHVDPVWDKRHEFIESCRSVLDSKVSHLTCPAHRSVWQSDRHQHRMFPGW